VVAAVLLRRFRAGVIVATKGRGGGGSQDRGLPGASSSIEIAASPETVYELVSDVVTLPRWAEECVRCKWLRGATTATVGARFMGINRKGVFRWFSVSEVTDADPGRCFGFEVLGRTAHWEYRIGPSPRGSVVTESWWDRRSWVVRHLLAPAVSGTHDRVRWNQQNIVLTLQRLKAFAEGSETEAVSRG
jgi:hypothetical protein